MPQAQTMTQAVRDRQIVGVDSVGKELGKATIPRTANQCGEFKTVRYGIQDDDFWAV
ncbi:MAG: hypothetical protein AAF609_19065 [Cyanobacteria bacterium P01_C01_bin.120]